VEGLFGTLSHTILAGLKTSFSRTQGFSSGILPLLKASLLKVKRSQQAFGEVETNTKFNKFNTTPFDNPSPKNSI
jgi:hypothetical protein